jgi:hypothetical protein
LYSLLIRVILQVEHLKLSPAKENFKIHRRRSHGKLTFIPFYPR